MLKKLLSLFLALSMIFSLSSCMAGNDIKSQMSAFAGRYQKGGFTLWWEVVAYVNAGEKLNKDNILKIDAMLEYKDFAKQMPRLITMSALKLKGYDIKDNADYSDLLSKYPDILNEEADYFLSDRIFASYALIAGKKSGILNTDIDTDEIITKMAELLKKVQKPDGGFVLSGEVGDCDLTYYALPFLSVNKGKEYDKAIEFIKNNAHDDFTYSSFGSPNSNSTALAAAALAVSENVVSGNAVSDNEYEKVLKALNLFKIKNGFYTYLANGKKDNALSSAQVYLSLGEIVNHRFFFEELISK